MEAPEHNEECPTLHPELIFVIFEQAAMWEPGSLYPLVVGVPYISRELRRRGQTVVNFLDDRIRVERSGETASFLGSRYHGRRLYTIAHGSAEAVYAYGRPHGVTIMHEPECDWVTFYNHGQADQHGLIFRHGNMNGTLVQSRINNHGRNILQLNRNVSVSLDTDMSGILEVLHQLEAAQLTLKQSAFDQVNLLLN